MIMVITVLSPVVSSLLIVIKRDLFTLYEVIKEVYRTVELDFIKN